MKLIFRILIIFFLCLGIGLSAFIINKNFYINNAKYDADHPDVSVIIPIYNGQKYIPKMMRSMLNQTHKNIELICINDGSTDKTLAMLNKYAKKYQNIRVFSQENQGIGITRNRGLDLSKGKYVIFLDVDDSFDKRMLETLYKKAEETNSDIVICNSNLAGSQRRVLESINRSIAPINVVFNLDDIPNYIFNVIRGGQIWDKFYRKDFLIKNNIKFPNLKNAEDLKFSYLSLALAERILIVDERFITYYNHHKDSNSNRLSEAPLATLKALLMLKKDLENAKIYDKVERSYLNVFFDCFLWNFSKVGMNEKMAIMEDLDTVLLSLKIHEKPEDYFYDKSTYDFFVSIVHNFCINDPFKRKGLFE